MHLFLGHLDFEFVRPCWSLLLFLGVLGLWEWAQVNFKIANNMFNFSKITNNMSNFFFISLIQKSFQMNS